MKTREIKFRVWDVHLKEMNYNPALWGSSRGGIDELNTSLNRMQEQKILMQFTGLKDSKGVEIFEGDVYRDEFSIDDENGIDERVYFVCVFFKQLASFCWITIDEHNLNPFGEDWDKDEEYPYSLNEDEMDKITIIGNIYEQPKLLNK